MCVCRILNESFMPHGLKVVQAYAEQGLRGLIELERRWRQHFLSSMQPKFLPPLWSVDHNHEKYLRKYGENLLINLTWARAHTPLRWRLSRGFWARRSWLCPESLMVWQCISRRLTLVLIWYRLLYEVSLTWVLRLSMNWKRPATGSLWWVNTLRADGMVRVKKKKKHVCTTEIIMRGTVFSFP